MPTVTANEAKARFGAIMEHAQREPVTITRHGRPSTVILSAAEKMKSRQRFLEAMKACQDEAAANGMTEADLEDILKNPE